MRGEKNKRKRINKPAQVTIFIIIAILIVSAILIFFLYIQPTYFAPGSEKMEIERCIEKSIQDEINILGSQAGFAEPEFYYLYKNDRIGYLCYTNLYNKPCVVQKPFLKEHFEEQLKKTAGEKILQCYEDSIDNLKSRGYEVVAGTPGVNIELQPKSVIATLNAPVVISSESSQRFTKFTSIISSPIYDEVSIATSLLQYETKYGDSDISTLMIFYPNLIIDKIKRDDGTTVYIIQDKAVKTKFQFASRSYAWAAGYTGE